MSLSSHIQELRKKHQTLSAKVDAVQRSPSASSLEVAQLKKQKLMVKEEITRLTTH
ncbi:DUF465 domain-containing protein [Marivivens niveibacter]|uniref:DUF465 domain-containing protein n=1 Tax=Marivivens niveibacter TaxID=1930667 RepID=A0A251X0E3_9RHOB|nr:YdcH family protein [Marivivens niveibacter]OUD10056.1 DUF465 domain-containing protein [Marivivens niveibacter]